MKLLKQLIVLGLVAAGSAKVAGAWEMSHKVAQPGSNLVVSIGPAEIEMAWIQPGSFMMGFPASERPGDYRDISHQVQLTRGFWLGRYEVTQSQWESVMNPQGSQTNTMSDVPVSGVRWIDAVEFCNKLNLLAREAGLLPAGYEYSLPTEAQWEYSCRAGRRVETTADIQQMAWFSEDQIASPSAVGRKAPNAFGLHDMQGNVWEWCRDWYDDHPLSLMVDPTGPKRGLGVVCKGGAYNSPLKECRAATRDWYRPDGREIPGVGFRLCLSPATAPDSASVPIATR